MAIPSHVHIQQDVLKHPKGCPLWTKRCYSSSWSFISCRCFEASKTLLTVVNGSLLQGKLEHVWASEQVPVSGSAVAHVRASSSFIGLLKKWVEEWYPCLGWGLGPDSLWKVPSTHPIPETSKQRWHWDSKRGGCRVANASSLRCWCSYDHARSTSFHFPSWWVCVLCISQCSTSHWAHCTGSFGLLISRGQYSVSKLHWI